MLRGFSLLATGSFWAAVLISLGCQRSPSGEGAGGATPSPLVNSRLKNLNVAYYNFCAVNGRSPGGIDELAPYLVSTTFPESHREMEEECLRDLKEGKYSVIWNQQGVLEAKAGTDILTAYESRVAEGGGFVVFADGRVQYMTPGELEQATARHKPQRAEPKAPAGRPAKGGSG